MIKRTLDVIAAGLVLLLLGWLIALLALLASLEAGGGGLFRQARVGKGGTLFTLLKIRTMCTSSDNSTVTVKSDPRITRLGRWLRRFKLDELPQFVNVLLGQMSLVGPRPDVPGYADCLTGRERRILSCRPGITGPATLAFRLEEEILEECEDPVAFNRQVIFPVKTALNLRYVESRTLALDLLYLIATVFPGARSRCGVPEFGASADRVRAWHRDNVGVGRKDGNTQFSSSSPK